MALAATHRPPATPEHDDTRELREATFLTIVTGAGLAVALVAGLLAAPAAVSAAALTVSYLAGALRPGLAALRELREGRLDIDLLMVTAALAAAAVGEARDGAILLTLFNLAGVLEGHAMSRTRRAVTALMELRPDEAILLVNGRERRVSTSEVAPGDLVLVKPGERIPVDGVLEQGFTVVDESSMTGESLPVDKEPGAAVLAGTVNSTGVIVVRCDRHAGETTLARMITLVTEAQEEKSPSQRFGDWFGQRYAIAVLAGSALALLVFMLLGETFGEAMYRAATLLVVASPCAIVISVPAATLSAIAANARRGILFKGAASLEDFGGVTAFAFDKTGTLTQGRPEVTDVIPLGGTGETELLEIAMGLESLSDHPLARGIVRYAAGRSIAAPEIENAGAMPGTGVRGELAGVPHWAGNERVPQELEVELDAETTTALHTVRERGRTAVLVGSGERVLGVIGLADTVRPEARAFLQGLRRRGIIRTVMLTGDSAAVAHALARELGIPDEDVHAGLLPEQKVDVIRELRRSHRVAYLGDGINDAPALATADIGMAMGGIGSDAALEAADAVVIADDLSLVPHAVHISRATNRVLRQNLAFATGIMAVMVLTTLFWRLPLPLGVIGHEGGTLLVVANGLRLLRFGGRNTG